ncbi:hypothetical protein [Geodermatophilus chilensis]|nr:hypothetical protein [Geodermatophilus chilensis]
MTVSRTMYHPQLDNRQARVSQQSVDDYAARGWLQHARACATESG